MLPYKQSDWFNYTGIFRRRIFEASDSTYVVRSDVKPLDINGNLQIKTVLNNKLASGEKVSLSYQVYEAALSDANKASEFAEDLLAVRDGRDSYSHACIAGSVPEVDSFTLNVPIQSCGAPRTRICTC